MARRNILYKSKKTTFIAGSAGQPAYALPMFSVEGQGGMPMPPYARSEAGLSADHAYGEI